MEKLIWGICMKTDRIKYKVNVDYLKLCYIQPAGLWEYFYDINWEYYNKNGLLYMDNYKLFLVEMKTSTMKLSIIVNDGVEDIQLGILMLTNDKDYEGERGKYCFFTFENSALYHIWDKGIDGICYNSISCMDYIALDLGLKYNSITQIDVAFDCNVNIISLLRKYIKDLENYLLILNGKAVEGLEKLQDYCECFGRNRIKLENNPTLYFSHKKKSGLSVRVYDKLRELREHSTEKISRYWKWMGFETKRLFRTEITIKSDYIRDFFKYKNIVIEDGESPLCELQDGKFLAELFLYNINKVIRFTNKKTRHCKDLIDIICE